MPEPLCEFQTNVNCIDEVRASLERIRRCIRMIQGGNVAGIASYITLSDTNDTDYVNKAGYIPVVNADQLTLDLRPIQEESWVRTFMLMGA